MQAHSKEIDWPWLEGVMEEYHLTDFFNYINAICIQDLGFDAALFPAAQVDLALKDRVLADILQPEFSEASPASLLPRLRFKFKRWKANAWKHKMCYSESMWSAFWSGVWGHILKPKGI